MKRVLTLAGALVSCLPALAAAQAPPPAPPVTVLKEIGTLEKGKEADIVAVPGDPLKDIHVTERVLFVMKGGRVFKGPAR